MGRCESLGSLRRFLWYAPDLYRAVSCVSPSRIPWRCTAAVADGLMTETSFVYWYGRQRFSFTALISARQIKQWMKRRSHPSMVLMLWYTNRQVVSAVKLWCKGLESGGKWRDSISERAASKGALNVVMSEETLNCRGLFLFPLWNPIPRSQVRSPVLRSQDKNLWTWPGPIATVAMSLNQPVPWPHILKNTHLTIYPIAS